MKYTSPFHLLPERNVSILEPSELKRWKKELMLEFDLQASTAIRVGSEEYDKNDVIQAFDLLKDMPEYHWRLYKNQPLLDFIERGETSFFYRKKNWTDFADVPYRNWLAQWFIPAYDKMLSKLTSVPERKTVRTLKSLYSGGFVLPQEWQDAAHQSTYRAYAYYVMQAENILEDEPIVKNYKLTLNPKIAPFLSIYYAEILTILPENFAGIREDYGIFAHNVIAEVFSRPRSYDTIEKGTLKLLKKAAKIDVKIRKDDFSRNLLYDLNYGRYLEKTSNFGGVIWLIIFAILFGSISKLAGCNDKSPSDGKFIEYHSPKKTPSTVHRLPSTVKL